MSLPRFLDKMCVSGVERLDGGENTLVVLFFVECMQDVVQVQATNDYVTMRVQAR